jgi:hypothetical protein
MALSLDDPHVADGDVVASDGCRSVALRVSRLSHVVTLEVLR